MVVLALAAGALLLGVLTIASRETAPTKTVKDDPAPDIRPTISTEQNSESPPVVVSREHADPGESIGNFRTTQGEIQVPRRNLGGGRNGRLAQRFVYDEVEPLQTPGWQRFRSPRIWIYLSDAKLLYITAEEAELYVPEQRPQSGELKGQVQLKYYETDPNSEDGRGAYDPALVDQTPTAIFEANSLSFDMESFEARTAAHFTLRTPKFAFAGRGLSLIYDEKLERLARLTVDDREFMLFRPPAEQSNSSPDALGGVRQNFGGSETGTIVLASMQVREPHSPATAGQAGIGVRYYTIDMTGSVIAARGLGSGRVTAEGSRLSANVALSDDSAQDSLVRVPPAGRSHHALLTEPVSLPALMSMVMLAQSERRVYPMVGPEEVQIRDVVITGSGPMSVRPVDNRPASLQSDQDAHVEMEGSPLTITSDKAVITGSRLDFAQDAATLRIDPAPGQALAVDLKGVGILKSREAAHVFTSEGRAEFRGLTDFIRAQEQPPLSDSKHPLPSADLTALPPGFTITSTRGMDLTFDETGHAGEEFGPLKKAEFKGDVRVSDPRDYTLTADSVAAEFGQPPTGSDDPLLQAITAHGQVRMKSRDGQAGGDEMTVNFEPNDRKEPTPRSVELLGKVFAEDPTQRIDCGYLRLGLVESERDDTDPDAPAAQRAADALLSANSSMRVESVLAQKNVNLRLSDNTRIFGDRLEAEPLKRSGNITGAPVVVVTATSQAMGERIELRDRQPAVGFVGSSTFILLQPPQKKPDDPEVAEDGRGAVNLTPTRMMDEVIRILGAGAPGATDAPFPIPSIPAWVAAAPWPDATPDADLTGWQAFRVRATESADFNSDSGAIDMAGSVFAESAAGRLERNTVFAARVRIEMLEIERKANSGSRGVSREVIRAVATGRAETPAKLQSFRFFDETQRTPERGVYVESPVIDVNRLTEQMLAIGAGKMLLTDAKADPNAATTGDAPGATIPFSGRGMTSFEWRDRMTVDGDSSTITLNDGVVMRHKPLGQDEVIHLQAVKLVATFARRSDMKSWEMESIDQPFQLTTATATGQVFVDGGGRKVTAGKMEYSELTRTATIEADPGEFVTIESAETVAPVQAQRLIWNLFDNTVRIEGAAPVVNPGPGG